jgi:hypothetical protein
MQLTLTIGDVLAIIGILTGPCAIALIWAIRLEGKVKEMGISRAADMLLIETRRVADASLQAERQERVDEKLGNIHDQLKALPAMQRSVDHVVNVLSAINPRSKP